MSDVDNFADDLRLAHVLADTVERYTMSMFNSADLEVTSKGDGTLVTQADRQTEELIRSQLQRSRGRDVVQGEELPTTGHGDRRWIIDPIDGTTNYIRGVPVWGTLIALVVAQEPVLGLVAAPALSRRWWAASGSGAWTGRSLSQAKQIHVSDTTLIEHASMSHAALDKWWHHPQRAGFLDLARSCWRTRGYGDFWTHCLVAEGAVDIGLDPALAVHDMAALAPIVTEAGGRFSDTYGEDGPFGMSAVSTNGELHQATIEALASNG